MGDDKDLISTTLDATGDAITGLFDDLWTGFADLLPDVPDDDF